MRLDCPNCDTGYEVPDGMVPAAGRHVQCTACHTRWFARGSAEPAPSDEEILTRLEARSLRPEPAPPVAEVPATDAPPPVSDPVVLLRPRAQPVEQPEPPVVAAPSMRASRLDLDPPMAALPVPPPPASSGRFGLGLALALLLFLLALGAYDSRGNIAASVPEAAPPLDAYAAGVDDLRTWAEAWIAPLRARLDTATSG